MSGLVGYSNDKNVWQMLLKNNKFFKYFNKKEERVKYEINGEWPDLVVLLNVEILLTKLGSVGPIQLSQ